MNYYFSNYISLIKNNENKRNKYNYIIFYLIKEGYFHL